MKLSASILVLVAAPAVAAAQDPIATLPDAYKVQFDNEWVKVVRVHYDAGAKLPEHTHPAGTTAYVYLNDSDGVVFRHSSGSRRSVTRPAVKTGSVRVASGPSETHTAENPAKTPSDFVRLLFKTEAGGERNQRRRLAREAYPAGDVVVDVQLTSGQMRITRVIVPPGKSTELATTATEPSLLIEVPSGQERWLGSNQRETLGNTGATPMEYLRFDFLTPPDGGKP